MSLADVLVSAWIGIASPDESGEEFEARVTMIAEEVVALDATLEEKALTAATIRDESQKFLLSVHAGTKRGDRGRAWCLGQLHKNPWLPSPQDTVGTDRESTRRCLNGVLAAYRGGKSKRSCSSVDRAIAMYATGRGCGAQWEGTKWRAELTWRYLYLMQKAERETD